MKKLMIVMSLFIGITFSCKKETPQPQDKQTIQTPPPPTNDTVPVTDSIQDSLETIDFYFDITGDNYICVQFNIIRITHYNPIALQYISPNFLIAESNNTSHTTWQGKSGEKLYIGLQTTNNPLPRPKTFKCYALQLNKDTQIKDTIYSYSVYTNNNISKIDSLIIR